MPSDKRRRSVLVQMETPNLIPERDLGKKPILEAHDLGIDFGGLTAVDDFNIAMGRTEISGLIGPNGAGKTTIFNLLTNVYRPTRGTILLDGYDTAGKSVIEKDANSSMVTTWTVAPAGTGSTVTVKTAWQGAGGIGGFFEKTFAPLGLRKIQDEVLGNLKKVVEG